MRIRNIQIQESLENIIAYLTFIIILIKKRYYMEIKFM